MLSLRDSWRRLFLAVLLGHSLCAASHPLRLSLSELEYVSDEQRLTISLRLFLTDVNEALLFDPNSDELAFCQENESPDADSLLVAYLERFFYVKVNGEKLDLRISDKELSGEGDNTALAVLMEYWDVPKPASLEIKNAVFTDLFFDQNNVIYVHVDDVSKSLMLSKKTPVHTLKF